MIPNGIKELTAGFFRRQFVRNITTVAAGTAAALSYPFAFAALAVAPGFWIAGHLDARAHLLFQKFDGGC